MYKNKINRIIFGIFVFMLASINAFAKCSEFTNVSDCVNGTEDNFHCNLNQIGQCYRTDTCVTGYKKNGNSCVKTNNTNSSLFSIASQPTFYSDKLKMGVTLTFKSSSDKFNSVDIACKHNDGSYKYVGNVLSSNDIGKKMVFVSWNVKGWKLGTWNCWSYNKTKEGFASRVDFSIWKSTFPTCADVNNYSGDKKAQCNTKKADNGDKCYWDDSNSNCIKSNDVPKDDKKDEIPITKKYSISFNENGGYGLECNDSSWSVPSPGICKKTGISSGTSIAIPKTSNAMTGPDGLLVGWTKTNCNLGNVIKDSSVKVTSNSEYKACYREDIGGYRYLQKGFLTDGGTTKFKCGDSAFIEYCVRETSGEYCFYYEDGQYRKIHRTGLAENSDAGKTAALASCGSSTITSTDQKNINKYMYALTNSNDYECGEALYVTTCVDNVCNYNKISKYDGSEISSNGTIKYENITDNNETSKKTCEKTNVAEDDKKCTNKTDSNNRGTDSYTVCYEYGASQSKIKNTIKDYYNCADGYKIDETSIYADSRESCNDKKTYCSRTYEVTCTRSEGKYKPTLEVSSGNLGSDGRTGIITVRAKSSEGRIIQYYASEIYKTPTETTRGWVDVNNDTFTITSTPGIKYIWVKDSKGNISSGVGGAVFDTVNTDTTINKLEISDSNNNILPPTGNTAYKVEGITSNSYVRLSNKLVNDSVIANNGFNPYTMEYKIEVDTPTISVYATLTSSDSSYVNGYEPRTVNLDYGMNTILIKIQNKEGKVRTYTILVNRVDDRKADNTLSDLSIDVGNINFNSNKTEYKIEIPYNTEKVNVNATIGSVKATFVDGYKPGIVNIVGDTTVNFIKVKSETGSTRTYVLTFIKEGTDEIKKKNLMLADLVIPGVYVAFEEEIANYNISVAFETELINLNYDLKDKDSSATVYFKSKNDSDYRVSSNQGIKLDVGENFVEIKIVNSAGEESFYRLTIIRKEFGLGISNDTTLKDLSVLGGYNIDFNPNVKEYTVKIKQEKSLVITAIPNDNRAEVFIRGNDELTGFSTVRVKVVAENGEFDTYSIDIKKDAFNKTVEIAAIVAGVVIILGSSCIIVIKNKSKKNKEYYEE